MGRLGKFSVVSRLVLPDSIVWYTSCEVSGPDPQDHARQVRDFLHSRVPIEVRDLSIDWYIDGDFARIAYVENHNLKVAEEFAVQRRFNPVEFVALPADPAVFGRIAGFGLTEFAIRRGMYADDRRTAPLPASPARTGNRSAHASGDTTSTRRKAGRTARILTAAILGSALALLSPAENATANEQGGLATGPSHAPVGGQAIRLAGVLDGGAARPLRRPGSTVEVPDAGSSETASTFDNFRSPKLGGSFTSGTYSFGHMIQWQRNRVNAGRTLDDRGFDPRAVSYPVLDKFKVGHGDRSQAELLAHVRNTVGLAQELVLAETEITPEEVAVDVTTEQQVLVTTLPARGLTESSVDAALARLLDSHNRPETVRGASPGTQDLPAAPSGMLVAGPDTQLGRPEGRAGQFGASPPENRSAISLSGIKRPVRRPASAVEAAHVVTTGFEIAFDRPVRRERPVPVTPVERPVDNTRVAVVSIQPEEPATSALTPSNIVVSLANETLEIIESDVRLIGIFGQDRGSLRALVRLPNGDFESIYRGSDFEDGRVVEIRRDSVVYERDSKRYLLTFAD